MSPIVNEARQKYRGRVNFVDANLDQPGGKEIAQKHNVIGYPVLLLLDGKGKQANILRGVFPFPVLEKALNELLAGK